jgi:beta-mannosidase
MKHTRHLQTGWQICKLGEHGRLSPERVTALSAGRAEEWLDCVMPAGVHEVLLEKGRIEDPAKLLTAEPCRWVAEHDWVYRLSFDADGTLPAGGRRWLHFRGLDTVADVYLNGERIAFHNDLYLPLRIDVTSLLRSRGNVLLIHFYSPHRYLQTLELPAAWQGCVAKNRLLRKPHEDFNAFNGIGPYLTPIGVYDAVELVAADALELDELELRTWLSDGYDAATITLVARGGGACARGDQVVATLRLPSGEVVARVEQALRSGDAGAWSAEVELAVQQPQLWWPRGYGQQPLYELETAVLRHGNILDRATRQIGFRDVRCHSAFDFSINGKRVKLWGINLTPLHGYSHRWDSAKFRTLLDLVENCNIVTLRAWGPGAPWNEELYHEADRRGLLIWHEFFHTWGMYPDDPAYQDLCRREAEHQVRTLKHHASLLMWCGGNEMTMGAERQHPGKPAVGRVLYEQVYRDVCASLDPTRPYIYNSPYGGAFANDPAEGDSHSYNHQWYVPGDQYPILFGENTRFSPPLLKSMQRYLGDDLWPAGFDGRQKSADDPILPPSWQKITAVGPTALASRLGAVEELYDTGDTPQGLIYRLGTGHGQWIRRCVERYRRGRPSDDVHGPRRVMGHYLWKLNNTWPQVYSQVVDDLNEPTIAYYALRRAYQPILLSFDIADHIHLWLINDTAAPVRGRVNMRLVDLFGSSCTGHSQPSAAGAADDRGSPANERQYKVLHEMSRAVDIAAGEATPLMKLDELGMFDRNHALYAELCDETGHVLTRTVDFPQMERRLRFPDPMLAIEWDGDALIVSTDRYARSVELQGQAGDDEFGWLFEDNFFDLMPWEQKRVRLLGRHRHGRVRARSAFGSRTASVDF